MKLPVIAPKTNCFTVRPVDCASTSATIAASRCSTIQMLKRRR